jgi:integrase
MVIETLAKSGMRLGECLAMHPDHLDVSNSQYMIIEKVRHGKFGNPKTGKRLIDLPEGLVAELQNFILAKRKEALSEGEDITYLFPGITQRLAQKGLERACRAAKVRLRATRTTCGTPMPLYYSWITTVRHTSKNNWGIQASP